MARRFVPLLAILLLVAFSLPSDTLAAPLRAIVTKALDSPGNVGTYSSLALDAESNPVISYRHQGDQNLKFIYCDDPACSTSTIRTLDSSGDAGYFTSLKLNSQGNPVIAYFTSGGGLKLALCSTPTCEPGTVTIRTLDNVSANTWHPSLQLDANDNPVISYSRTTTPNIGLWLAYCADPACSSHQLTQILGGATQYSSLQLDAAGNPVISYLHTGSTYMGLVHCSDPQCSGTKSDVVIQATTSQDGTSLALNASGNPVIAFRRTVAPAALALVTCQDPNCTNFEQNDLNSTGGLYVNLKLDPAGNPAVSYYTGNPDQNIVLARCSTPTCELGSVTNTTIANAGSPNYPNSMALDCSGNPVISYYHSSTSQNLRLAYEDTAIKCAHFGGTPAAPGPLTFVAEPGESSQLTIEVSNDGMTDSLLDVSLHSISNGYDIVSGLPISGLATTDPAVTITLECSSFPQTAGTLVLGSNDPTQPTITYALSCKPPLVNEESPPSSTTEISPAGVTTLQLGRLLVGLPASAIPPGQTGCQISAIQLSSSASYGFALDDAVFDVKVHCDSGELTIFLAPLTICIQPPDGVANNKLVYHSHNGASFLAMGSEVTQPGFVCGQTRTLSLFTLGQLSLPNTGFAPGRIASLPELAVEYANSSLVLSIPQLGVELNIVGVPQGPNGWDVSWLGSDQAGYLYGTSYPTWQGNSVLTAHVWNADNTPGAFYALKDLQHGDRFTITTGGVTYVYEVRSNQRVLPSSLDALRGSDYSLITLITCESFSEASGKYLYRRAVQAVLVEVH
ncbi:MAG: class F sortase [Anaerolineales bacterium]|nr:class F sortase [Anaerolineales bacterium]